MSFKKLIETAKQGQQERDNEILDTNPSTELLSVDTESPATPIRRRTRPLGKRSNPEYVQALSYLPEELYLKVKQELLNTAHRKKDFSDLVAELLGQWLEKDK